MVNYGQRLCQYICPGRLGSDDDIDQNLMTMPFMLLSKWEH